MYYRNENTLAVIRFAYLATPPGTQVPHRHTPTSTYHAQSSPAVCLHPWLFGLAFKIDTARPRFGLGLCYLWSAVRDVPRNRRSRCSLFLNIFVRPMTPLIISTSPIHCRGSRQRDLRLVINNTVMVGSITDPPENESKRPEFLCMMIGIYAFWSNRLVMFHIARDNNENIASTY